MWQLLFPAVAPIVDKLVSLIPDSNARAKAREEFELELQRAVSRASEMQVEVNKIEAGHSSVFVAGWRPGCGWLCVLGIGWSLLIQPIYVWAAIVFNLPGADMPKINTDGLFELIFAMLGLGSLRSYEKVKGVASR